LEINTKDKMNIAVHWLSFCSISLYNTAKNPNHNVFYVFASPVE